MVGMRVFLARHRRNQVDLAAAAGISTASTSQILSGHNNPSKPTLDAWLLWAKSIDPAITYEELFLAPEPETQKPD